MKLHKNLISTFCCFILVIPSIYPQEMDFSNPGEQISVQKLEGQSTEIENLFNNGNFTGNWGGMRSSLSSKGIDFEFVYTGEFFSNVSGGIKKGSGYLDNVGIGLSLDLESLFNWNGASFFVSGLGNHGTNPYEFSGALQGISNIEADDTWKLYEIRLEQILFNNRMSILAGLYDLNSEFDVRETSGIFINPSHGIGAEYALTGKNGPSIFPNTSLALRLQYNFSNSFNIKTAVFDGVPGNLSDPYGTHIILDKEDGLLLASEINFENNESFGADYFKVGIGGWYYTSDFKDISEVNLTNEPVMHKGNYGIYAFAEKFIYEKPNMTGKGLAFFLRSGVADKNVNAVDFYFGGGLTYYGLLNDEGTDVCGIAIAAARNNDKLIKLFNEDGEKLESYEINFELTYIVEVMEWLKLQPDLQYVINPSAEGNVDKDALALGLRFEINF